jgi:hypothetical protein
MLPKKSDSQHPARTRLSLASRLLGDALRGTVTAALPPAEEPWRNTKLKGKNRAKRRK